MSEERTGYTTQRYAELESQIADSAPDELTQLRADNIRLRNELDKQVNAWGGYVDAHAGNYSRMNARIAELEADIARLEADNRRLRHLDAMPVDALDRIMYDVSGDLLEEWTQVREWLDSRDGAA